MAHLVESMAYTNEVPWHGLGFSRPEGFKNVKQLLKDAKLDWRVERWPLTTAKPSPNNDPDIKLSPNEEVPGFAALVRDSDHKVLDVVGSRYVPTQNADVFEFFKEFVDAGGATLETAGSLREGRYVWGLASLNASFKMRGDDVVKGYLLVASPHEQGKSLVIKFTTVRVVCNNTLTLALAKRGNEFRMNHRNEFNQDMIVRAKDTLGIAREQLGEFEANARKLQKVKLTRDDCIRILAGVYQPDANVKELITDFADKASPRLTMAMDILSRAPGAQPDNGWGLLNAVTYYSDHVASRTADKRLTNAWLGRTANQKEAVLDQLLQMAA